MKNLVLLTTPVIMLAMGVASADPLSELPLLKEGASQRASSSDANWQNGNGDARPIQPGKTLTVAELGGPGMITHFWNTISAEDRGYPRLLVLRMYWDGEDQPSVECPIGDFFAVGHGLDVPFSSLPVSVTSEGRARNCYWPMPFRNSARITVTNEGKKMVHAFYFYVDWRKLPKLDNDTAYMHAMYRQEFPAQMGRNYLLADIEGRGHYVGTVLSVRQLTASWWGEGDDFFFIDGELEPSLRGTGSEDYFCDAWGLRQMATPYYGCPVMQGYEPYDLTTVYRWHITDPVIFEKSLRVEIEHKGVAFDENGAVRSGFEERADDFSSVAFWYQTEPHKPYEPMPAGYDRLYVDYSKLIEFESLMEQAKATSGALEAQGGGYSGGNQLFWTPQEQGQTLTVPLAVEQPGKYRVLLVLTKSWGYGKFDVLIGAEGQAETAVAQGLDQFNPSVVTEEQWFGPVELMAGPHTLIVRNAGKNPESTGYYLGLDAVMMDRVKQE